MIITPVFIIDVTDADPWLTCLQAYKHGVWHWCCSWYKVRQFHSKCNVKSVPCIADKLAEEVCEAERKDAQHGKASAGGAASSSDQESGDALHYVSLSSFCGNALKAVQQELSSAVLLTFFVSLCLRVRYS